MLALAAAAPAAAQLGLPDLPVDLPAVDRVRGLGDDALRRTDDLLDADVLREARAIELRTLLRANPTVLEALPNDDLVIRSEVLALDPSDAALAAALGQGFAVARERQLAGLGVRVVVLAAPPGATTSQALDTLRALDPAGAYDFNHIYSGSGVAMDDFVSPTSADDPTTAGSGSGPTVGMIDGGVDVSHRSLQGVIVVEQGFQAAGYVPSVHGTAVASLLIAEDDAPAPRLLVADVYGGAPTGGAADSVAAAFSWLAEEQAPVINVSLVGPENALLDVVISRVAERGALIVAAVGNDGPAAAPLYPAAHPDVIAVTGVDRSNRALIEAGRGAHVMFAARGEDVRVAELGGGTAEVRGTSFAAPVVARQLAVVHRAPDAESARAAVQMLIDTVRDLRPRGRDETYGYGLVDDDSARVLTASAQAGGAN